MYVYHLKGTVLFIKMCDSVNAQAGAESSVFKGLLYEEVYPPILKIRRFHSRGMYVYQLTLLVLFH